MTPVSTILTNATAAVPSHFNQPVHSIVDMELISLELQPTLSMSRGKAREAHLIDRGKTLSLDQTVWTEEMNIELLLFLFLL